MTPPDNRVARGLTRWGQKAWVLSFPLATLDWVRAVRQGPSRVLVPLRACHGGTLGLGSTSLPVAGLSRSSLPWSYFPGCSASHCRALPWGTSYPAPAWKHEFLKDRQEQVLQSLLHRRKAKTQPQGLVIPEPKSASETYLTLGCHKAWVRSLYKPRIQ